MRILQLVQSGRKPDMNFKHLQTLVEMMFVPDGAGGIIQKYDSIDPK